MSKEKKVNFNPENYIEVPLTSIVVEGWNYKKTDEELQKKLVANIKKNGQIENLLVRDIGKGKYGLVNGHHRLEALTELGYETAYVYNLGKIDIKLAKRIAIETNETKFESDNLQLATILKEIGEDFDDLIETLPFDDKELENFDKMLDFDWDDEDEDDKNTSDEELGDGSDNEDRSKSETLISAGGDRFRTVKLELEPKLADRFEKQVMRFVNLAGSTDKPIELIVNFLEQHDDATIIGEEEAVPRKKSKKKRRRRSS